MLTELVGRETSSMYVKEQENSHIKWYKAQIIDVIWLC